MSDAGLRVLHLNTHDGEGGAGRACYHLHTSLLDAGADSWLATAFPNPAHLHTFNGCGDGPGPFVRTRLTRIRQTRLLQRLQPIDGFFPDVMGTIDLAHSPVPVAPEIVHLHWLAQFATSTDIRAIHARYGVPLVWTVMDMAPFTGGCHYSHGCERYTDHCGSCPIIRSNNRRDISYDSQGRKMRMLRGLRITLVGATDRICKQIRRSALFRTSRVERIPYGIDSTIFRSIPKPAVREVLGLPPEARVIFFGSTDHRDERKGMSYLWDAFHRMRGCGTSDRETILLAAGRSLPETLAQLPYRVVDLGMIGDDRLLAAAYAAADVFVCPSIEDAGPLMIPEALMCGTPVVAFADCGGMPELVQDERRGYLAIPRDSEDLARGLLATLDALDAGRITAESCREIVARESTRERQAERYLALYSELLHDSAGQA